MFLQPPPKALHMQPWGFDRSAIRVPQPNKRVLRVRGIKRLRGTTKPRRELKP